jgi:hypothetical protein
MNCMIAPSPPTAAQLVAFLAAAGVDVAAWRHPHSNTVADLLAELAAGECRLFTEPPRRELTIIRLVVVRGGRVLIEAELIETPGRRQTRGREPSEKVLPGETPEAAARRGLREELGCPDEAIRVLGVSGPRRDTRASTPSYPGLRSDYRVFDVGCEVAGLPDGEFETEETTGMPAKRITHRWRWADRPAP